MQRTSVRDLREQSVWAGKIHLSCSVIHVIVLHEVLWSAMRPRAALAWHGDSSKATRGRVALQKP
jgi:hypothetical protein